VLTLRSSNGEVIGKYSIDEYGNLFCYSYECVDPDQCGWKESGQVFTFPYPPRNKEEAIERIKDYKGFSTALTFSAKEENGFYLVDVKSPTEKR